MWTRNKAGSRPSKKLDPLNAKEFADVMNQAYDAAGKPRQDAFDPAKYPDGQITRTNWMDEIFRTAKIQDYNASVRGGGDMGRYYLSFGYRKGEGILLNTYNERYTVRMNTDYQLKPWLKIGENMTMSVTDGNGANTTSAYTGAIISAIFYPPHIRPYTADGGFSGLPAQYAGAYGDVINPVAYLQRIDSKVPETKIFFNPYADINITKGLVFRSSFSITKSFRDAKTFKPKPMLAESWRIVNDTTWEFKLRKGVKFHARGGFSPSREFTGMASTSAGLHDPHYSEWRRRQIDALDRDYDEYRRENQSRFENEFSNWRTTREGKRQLLGQVREHMSVVGSDEEHVGTVDCVRGDRIVLTKGDSADDRHHSLSCSMVDRVEGDRVILDQPAAEAKRRFESESRERGFFRDEREDERGPHILNRSFSGTYER